MQVGKPCKSPDLNHLDSINNNKFTNIENDSLIHNSSNNNIDTYLVSITVIFKPKLATKL